ncbi:hypothetical protein HanXRQr2_Chr13g0591621 [Helianthus annuus]|uniref:Uncharacterized protein n=1 Tax=Helianthus annuus TaxID=4232 RepID=A0A9K3HB41_HELAN|nr:hypothetical protein HanXRQr2_Chr13g0591621 [Helianthus annuus]KAJ0849535.1 hypothetical protein HanPSC8_Chr13g0569821 [Helianthus annuus]
MSEIIGISNARQVWLALETAYSHCSTNRMHILRDNLVTTLTKPGRYAAG